MYRRAISTVLSLILVIVDEIRLRIMLWYMHRVPDHVRSLYLDKLEAELTLTQELNRALKEYDHSSK